MLHLMGSFIPSPPPAEFWRWAAEQDSSIVSDLGIPLIPESVRSQLVEHEGSSDADIAIAIWGWADLSLRSGGRTREGVDEIIGAWVNQWPGAEGHL